MWFLFVISILVIIALGFACYKVCGAALRLYNQNKAWEVFYENSLDDMESVITMLDQLMERKQMISDDPDIRNVYRAVVILRDILVGYINAKTEDSGTQERKKD